LDVEDIERHVAQDGMVVGSVVEAVSGLILVQGHIECPVAAVFHGLPRRLAGPNDFPDGLQPWPMLTRDKRLAAAPGHQARIELV
jgi:hypothetical protein